jgi:hypothetical protein
MAAEQVGLDADSLTGRGALSNWGAHTFSTRENETDFTRISIETHYQDWRISYNPLVSTT